MRFHPEIPLVAFLGLVHRRVALAPPVLRRGWRGDEARINERAFAHEQFFLPEQRAHFLEDAPPKVVPLEQVAEIEQRGGVRHGLAAQIDAGEAAHGLAEGVARAGLGCGVLQFIRPPLDLHSVTPRGHARRPPLYTAALGPYLMEGT